MLNYLDQGPSYTYSVWPSSEIKKDIEMKFYQKPIYNYKIECETSSEQQSMRDLRLNLNLDEQVGASWKEMLELFRTLAAATLFVLIMTPILSNKATVVCTPLAFIVVAGMFLKIWLVMSEALEEFEDQTDRFFVPEWINDCLSDGIEIDLGAYVAET